MGALLGGYVASEKQVGTQRNRVDFSRFGADPVRLIGNAYLGLALRGGDLIAAHNLANAYHTDQTVSDG